MIVILLFATVAITAATNEEATASTHINPEYLIPREEYHKPLLYDPSPIYHETGRYHNNYFGQYAGDYNSHHEYIGHSYTPSSEPIDKMYGKVIVDMKPYLFTHEPSQNRSYNRYGFIPAEDAYHNVSPYVQRRVDNYAHNQGYAQDGHNYRLYDVQSAAKYPEAY